MDDPATMHDILIVDDEPTIHEVFDAVFEDAPYRLNHAATFVEAKHCLAQKAYVLVIVDKNLPDGCGLDLVEPARFHSPYCELIMITAYGNMDSATEAVRLGFHDYVTKPFDTDILRTRVEAAILKHKIRATHENTLSKIREVLACVSEGAFQIEASIQSMAKFAPAIKDQVAAIEGRVSSFAGTDEPLHDALMGVQELLVAITNLETQLRPIQQIERDFEVVRQCVTQLDGLARSSQGKK